MNTPPLLLGVTLLYWGWQTGLLLIAAAAAVLLEGTRVIWWRWAFSRDDLGRVWRVCTLLFLGMAGYLALTTDAQGATRAVMTMFQWYPLTVLPMIAAQVYSTEGKVHVGILSAMFRRKERTAVRQADSAIDLSYPFFAVCLLSASAAHQRTPWFYVGLCLLAGWALWSMRSRTFSPFLWVGLLSGVMILGYGSHVGLHALHVKLESHVTQWIAGFTGDRVDPYKSHTAIGSVGTLKLSNRIVLRLESGSGDETGLLLREASYNQYHASMWFAQNAPFHEVLPDSDGRTWNFGSGAASRHAITISAYLKEGEGLLALPNGTSQVQQLPVGSMKRSDLGAVQVKDAPGLIAYLVQSGRDVMRDGPPDDEDLSVPQAEAGAMSRIVKELGLSAQSPRQALQTVAKFFDDNFQYTQFRPEVSSGITPLSDFLFRTRSGHCEYFATATVLLLRSAGIPARYAIGYSVQEFSPLENRYVVRARHAHSWALVYADGVWQDFDTTPVSWVVVEQQGAPWWQALADLWSWATFKFSQWKWSEREGNLADYVVWLLIPLFAVLAWRLYLTKRVARREPADRQIGNGRTWPGADSEFYGIEQRLQELGAARYSWEPLSQWIQRIRQTHAGHIRTDLLQPLLSLHYRCRFDPKGISVAEKETLRVGVREWLDRLGDRLNPNHS